MNNFFVLLFLIVIGMAIPAFADAPAADPAPAAPTAVVSSDTTKYLFQLSSGDAEDAIGKALVQKGAGTKIGISINGHRNDALFSYSKPISVEIRGLQFEKPSRWSANLLFVADNEVVSAMPVAGHYEEIIEVPVLKREVRSGDVIGEADVEMRDFPMTRTRTDTITDIAQIIGKSPAIAISPSRPIRQHEIASPAIIKKNGIVSIRYISPGMEITTTGQALEEGAKGSVISVRNTVSRKIVRAVITDENTVDIAATGEPYAAN